MIILVYQDKPSEVHKEALDLRAHPEGSQSRLEISNISIEHFLMSTCQQCLEKIQWAVVLL